MSLDHTVETAPYLIFDLGESYYAIEASNVREVFWLPEITRVADFSFDMEGVINFRGRVVPLMNLNRRLGGAPEPLRPTDTVIILERGDLQAGIIVNQVREVQMIAVEDIEPVDDKLPGLRKPVRYVHRIAKIRGSIVLLLDVDQLLQPFIEQASASNGWNWLNSGEFEPTDSEFSEEQRSTLRERAESLAQAPQTESSAHLVSLAVIVLGTEYFGVDLRLVREFVNVREITPVPCCPSHIAGTINLRGEILTLLDIRTAFEMPAAGPMSGSRIMVVQSGQFRIGIVVDDVVEVTAIRPETIAPVPSAVKFMNEECINGAAPFSGRVLSILDLPRLFARPEWVVEEQV